MSGSLKPRITMTWKTPRWAGLATAWLGLFSLCTASAQEAPFDPTAWPPTIDLDATVHFKVVNDGLEAPEGVGNWVSNLQILSGGDQNTSGIRLDGLDGVEATNAFLNIGDPEYTIWADHPVIDVLMLVYGDAALLTNDQERDFAFLTGTLPEGSYVARVGGRLPVEVKNYRWNWVLFRIANDERDANGRYVGTLPDEVQGAFQNGGINGGTLRLQHVPGMKVRAVAFGQQGAFGEPEQINVFAPPVECDPEPPTNYVWYDATTGTGEHLVPLDDGDQLIELEEDIGPEGDKRKALRPEGSYMNFGITENYLGHRCNAPAVFKICIEYYDDPDSVDAVFGPEAYTTDASGSVAFVPGEQRQKITGTGEWKRRSWIVSGVSLHGINAGPHTAGVRLHFTQPVYISRFDQAILREGSHPLAGQDPLADCYRDPLVCDMVYQNYAEMDLNTGEFMGLAPGSSGGDQEMIQEEAGPDEDRRMAVRPAMDEGSPGYNHNYLNFAITDEWFGPSSQPNAHLAIGVTYYDDPALVGKTFRPEVWLVEQPNGVNTLEFFGGAQNVTLQGSGRWVEAYFEIPRIKFNGINQGPQAAARFVLSDKIAITRVRYAVIRPCGPLAGNNPLEAAKPALQVTRHSASTRIVWPAGQGWNLYYSDPLSEGSWQQVLEAPVVEDFLNVLELPAEDPPARFYRLAK